MAKAKRAAANSRPGKSNRTKARKAPAKAGRPLFDNIYFAGVAFIRYERGKRTLQVARSAKEAESYGLPTGIGRGAIADWFGAGTCRMDVGVTGIDCTFWSTCPGAKSCKMQKSTFDKTTKKWGPWVPRFFNPSHSDLNDPLQAWKCSCI
jgi:hypothetical protein